jgi:hypothetical protein
MQVLTGLTALSLNFLFQIFVNVISLKIYFLLINFDLEIIIQILH